MATKRALRSEREQDLEERRKEAALPIIKDFFRRGALDDRSLEQLVLDVRRARRRYANHAAEAWLRRQLEGLGKAGA